jgi:choline dehydrogenase-like flavoprotein
MDCDYAIIGSGFGGSVSGLRLAEKGYRVVMLEKGRRFRAEDFPRSNWNLRRWLWMPAAGFRGIFKMTFLRHVTVLSGVGVGGGSLVYANTLPRPKAEFFTLPSWGHLADWKKELAPHYATALQMLGAVQYPRDTYSDQVLRDIARDIGRPDQIVPVQVAVYFGEPGQTVPDPYLGGEGPDRTGCIQCGACMTGCRHNAKNTLDKNYLWLAEKRGLRIEADTEVTWVREMDGGYRIDATTGTSWFGKRRRTSARSPHTRSTAARNAFEPSRMNRMREFVSMPRSRKSSSRSVHTRAFSVAPSRTAKTRFSPPSVTPTATTSERREKQTPSMNMAANGTPSKRRSASSRTRASEASTKERLTLDALTP